MGKKISTGFINATINSIKVNTSKKCNADNYNNSSSRNVSYIVLHYTGNKKDTAWANANYFQSPSRGASAHFFVDDKEIYQSIELRDVAWHCGADTYYHNYCRNSNSIGIEMCCTAGNYKISNTTIKNAAHLTAYLCKQLGITALQVDQYVLRHYDVTHKLCPAQMSNSANDADWVAFKKQVKEILGGTATKPTITPSTSGLYRIRKSWSDVKSQIGAYANLEGAKKACKSGYKVFDENGKVVYPVAATTGYKVKVIADVLNVRKGPGTNYDITTTIKRNEVYTIVEEKNGWGKLKSGAGWICLEYTKKQ